MRPTLYVLLCVLLVPTVGLVGDIVTDGKLISTAPSGPPLEVASAGWVAGLNVDRVDGFDGDSFALAADTYTKAEIDALVEAASAADSRRWFYLETSTGPGADADTACDAGFHMASIYEILDVSNLRYDTTRGVMRDDSGNGPPQWAKGWVRTADQSWTDPDVGLANCFSWSSSSASDYGTWVWLGDPGFADWNSPASKISPWEADVDNCLSPLGVWCIED